MSKKKIKPVDLTATVNKMLDDYGDEVYKVLGDCIKETCEEARDELRDVKKFSPNGHPSGDYSRDWEYEQRRKSRTSWNSVVYNFAHYQLTHLLENGHVLKRGGRVIGSVQAYPHIKEVNDKAQENVVKKVEEML